MPRSRLAARDEPGTVEKRHALVRGFEHLRRWPWRRHLPLALAALSLALLLPASFYVRFDDGIRMDAHWKFALWWATQHGLVFGRDVVFTYGPLCFLEGRPEFQGVGLPLLLWDGLFYGALGYVLFRTYASLPSARARLVAFACLAGLGLSSGVTGTTLLLPLEIYFLFGYLARRALGWLVCATLATIIAFYVKVSTGLVGVVLLLGCMGYAALRSEQRRQALLAAACALAALLAAGWALHVDLRGYLRGSFEFLRGYPEAMALDTPGSGYLISLALVLIGALAIALLLAARAIAREPEQLLFAAITAGMYFLYFKQGFVRFDSPHYLQFFQVSPLLVGILYLYASPALRRALQVPLVLGTFASFSLSLPALDGEALLARWRGLRGYARDAVAQNEVPAVPAALASTAGLPRSFLKRIRKATVDVIPHDIGNALRHELTYSPRPVFQSYAAYTPYLDALDASFFDGPRAPAFVVYTHTALSGPFYAAWWTTPRTRLSLFRGYEVARVQGDDLLLQHRSVPLALEPGRRWTGKGRLGEPVEVPLGTGFTLFKASLKTSASGSVRALLYRPSEVDLEIQLQDQRVSFPVVRAHLADGLPVSPWIGDAGAARQLFNGKLENLPRPVQVSVNTPEHGAYRKSYEYELLELSIVNPKDDTVLAP